MTITAIRPLPQPEWLPDHLWRFRTFGVATDLGTLAVTDVGQGATLLLVHVGTWSFFWRDLVTLLAPHFRCVFLDAPGTGRSANARGGASLEHAADAVSSVIDALDLRDFTIVVHDLGGPAGLAAVSAMPDRVRGIVGMNAFAWRPTRAALRAMLTLMGGPLMRGLDVLTGFLPRISSTSFGVGRHMDELSRATFRAGMGPRERRTFHEYMRDARDCDPLYGRVTRALTGSLSHVPVLTIFGKRNDPFGFQKRWKELFPEARQEIVVKGNHFPMCDAPDFVAHTIFDWHRDQVSRTR